ncbi:MAG: ABC transporter substrate-binding protein [Cyanobacteria bacterium J06634_6]
MSKRNQLPALMVSLAITGALVAGGGWLIKETFFSEGASFLPTSSEPDGMMQGADGSSGKSVLPGEASEAKQQGLDAMATGDLASAKVAFTQALQENRNDPESLIYLNNAKIGSNAAYTIALSVPTSKFTNPSLEIMRGVAQAQETINQSVGVNGTPLKVLLLNDQGDLEKAKEVANSLVENPDVLGVIGHYASDTTLVTADVYETGKLPMISATSTAVKISESGEYIFRTVPSDRLAASTLSRYVLNTLSKKQAAVFYTGKSEYSQSVKSEFTTELLSNGGRVVANFDIDDPTFSSGSAVQAAKAAGAEVLMLALTEATEARSLQILSVNSGELAVVGGDSLYDYNILDSGREDAVGLTVAVPWHVLGNPQSSFVQTSQQLWGGGVSWRTATAYDAVLTIAAAIEQGGATRESIAEAMAGAGFSVDGATGVVSFLPDGDLNQPSQLVTVVKKPGGPSGTGFDYEPVQ